MTLTPYLLAASFALGFGAGVNYRGLQADSELAAQLQHEQSRAKAAETLNTSLYARLAKERKKIKVVEKEVIKKIYVPKIQKTDSDCNLSNSAKRLLNNNILSKTDAGVTESDTSSSDIRAADAIRYLNSTISQYNMMRAQCNALINFYLEAVNG